METQPPSPDLIARNLRIELLKERTMLAALTMRDYGVDIPPFMWAIVTAPEEALEPICTRLIRTYQDLDRWHDYLVDTARGLPGEFDLAQDRQDHKSQTEFDAAS